MSARGHYDVLVIGSGPAGHAACVTAAAAGRQTAIVEKEASVGGECVHRGTIPSKALRESAVRMRRSGGWRCGFDDRAADETELGPLMARVDDVVNAHEVRIASELDRFGVERIHGRAAFVSPRELELQHVDRPASRATADVIVVAAGSVPRHPPGIPIDHEHVLDSDSILSMQYLPASLTVLGSGVIACEYASIFAELGVRVTMVDKYGSPLGFLDPDLVQRFLLAFERRGSRFLGSREIATIEHDGTAVRAYLADGEIVAGQKMLVALGRVANPQALRLAAAGLAPCDRGHVPVNEHGQTVVEHIYAAGDIVGPPALATTAAEEGRRAVCHALGLPAGSPPETIPAGIYTIPEISSVGLTEAQALERHGGAVVGTCAFEETARGQISEIGGLLKLVADPEGERVLGVHVVGEGATEIVHLGQMALIARASVDAFVDNVFNFPTLAEAYRHAALEILSLRGVAGRAAVAAAAGS